ETTPTALFSLFAGVWVDRLPRRRILIVADLGRAVLLMTIPVAFVLGLLSMAQLYVVGFAVGTLSVFFIVAYQAYLPGLVGREWLSALLRHPSLRTLVAVSAIFVLLLSAQAAIFILYLSRDLRLDPSVLGLILAIGAAGALLGALLASDIARRLGIGPAFILG